MTETLTIKCCLLTVVKKYFHQGVCSQKLLELGMTQENKTTWPIDAKTTQLTQKRAGKKA